MSTPLPEFRAVYDAHFDYVWCSLRRLGVREADAFDLSQKVFLIVHAKLPDFEGRAQLSTWLFGICRRVASDYRRSAAVRREVITDATHMDRYDSASHHSSTHDETHHRAETAEALLDKLPEPQRVVFVMFELEELSGETIGQQLGISVGTVRSRLRLAREAFSREVKRLALARSSGRREVG